MAPKKEVDEQADGRLFYAVVPDYRTDDAGKVIKPVFKDNIVYKNTRDQVVDGIHTPGECKTVGCGESGIYVVDPTADDGKLAKKIMDAKVKDATNPIIGPFPTRTAAIIAVEEARPKTDKERLAAYEAAEKAAKASEPVPKK